MADLLNSAQNQKKSDDERGRLVYAKHVGHQSPHQPSVPRCWEESGRGLGWGEGGEGGARLEKKQNIALECIN